MLPIHVSLFSGKIVKPYSSIKTMTMNRFLLYEYPIVDVQFLHEDICYLWFSNPCDAAV